MSIEEQIKEVCDLIDELQEKLEYLYKNDREKYDEGFKDYFDARLRLQKLEEESFKTRKADIEGEDIDLYLKNYRSKFEKDNDVSYYIITLHGTKTRIGEMEIRYNLMEYNKHLGNIGAHLDEHYKGKRYSQQAFLLLHDIMLERGLTKPIFTVRKTNSSSIKSMKNIGTTLIGEEKSDYGDYYMYEYDIEKNRNK